MANASDRGGCGEPNRRYEQVLAGEVVGDRWKDLLHDRLMKEAAEKARRRAASGEGSADEPVVVQTALTLYVNFPRDREIDSAAAEVSCHCHITIFEDGSESCVCYGACDFPECCGPKPVVETVQ
jgi:hypothetical protein